MADFKKWLQDSPRIPPRPKDQKLPDNSKERHPDEKRALFKLQREARQSGATLHSKGEGGLPSSLVLGVMRRDKFACVECEGQQDLQVHHKTKEIERVKKNLPANILTICVACHDRGHQKADKKGVDVSEVIKG